MLRRDRLIWSTHEDDYLQPTPPQQAAWTVFCTILFVAAVIVIMYLVGCLQTAAVTLGAP